MYTTRKDIEVLQNALEVLQRTTGLTAELERIEPTFDALPRADAVIRIVFQDMEWHYVAEVKSTVTPANLGAVVHQLRNFPKKGIIITRHVTPQMAQRLKEMDIPFIDTAGNAYINEPPLFVLIKGNKPALPYGKGRPARAFQPTGLQLTFALFCNPGLEDIPFREIAEVANVALGTVGWVMRDLKQMGYLIDMGKRGRRLVRKKDLLERWAAAYPEQLRPKLLLGRYRAAHDDWWRNVTLDNFEACWGGEIAATLLTEYVKPRIVTIYTNEPLGRFLLIHRIKKDPQGDIEILKTFWKFEHNRTEFWIYPNLAPPLLIYADLLATGDPRNIETAEIIFEQEITRLIGED